MKLDEMELSDGRRLLDIWPDAARYAREGEMRMVSIPEGAQGNVFVEYGTGADRSVALYRFFENGEAFFAVGVGSSPKP